MFSLNNTQIVSLWVLKDPSYTFAILCELIIDLLNKILYDIVNSVTNLFYIKYYLILFMSLNTVSFITLPLAISLHKTLF